MANPKRYPSTLLLLLALGLTACPSGAKSGGPATPAAGQTVARASEGGAFLPQVPEPYSVKLWADVPNARSLALSPDKRTLFVGTREGQVHKVTVGQEGQAEKVEVFQEGLNGSNGVCFVGDDLYVAELLRVVKFAGSGGFPLKSEGEVVLEGLPNEKHHGWRYIKASPEGRIMISIGAPCNSCLRTDDERFASIGSFKPDGSDFRVEAHGVRNSVGFDWQPGSGDFYFTDNGRDMLGDDIPPCELNVLPKGTTDQHYGFPYYWGDNQRDDSIKEEPPKRDYLTPKVDFQAHTAPLGLYFPRHERWKGLLAGKALAAQHGSWNRSSPVGYQVVSVDLNAAEGKVEPFLWGFLDASEGKSQEVHGRPVDITELADGTLLVSDDGKGKIWAISPKNPKP